MGIIQKIGVETIPTPTVPIWKIQQPESLNIPAPVTVNLGFPIIDMPGCVVTRKNNRENKSTVSNDESGNVVLERNKRKMIGFMAQDVKSVIPEMVKDVDESSSFYSMEYGKLVSVLVKEIQELSAKVTALENA